MRNNCSLMIMRKNTRVEFLVLQDRHMDTLGFDMYTKKSSYLNQSMVLNKYDVFSNHVQSTKTITYPNKLHF